MNEQEEVRKLVAHYDQLAPDYRKLYSGNSRLTHFYKSRQARVLELLKEVKGGSLLEVGCGAGLMVVSFLKKGMDYWGVDLSPGMIKVCREQFRDVAAAHFSAGDSRHLDFPDERFDVVVSMGMLEYVRDEQLSVKEMARVIKPGGRLILTGITKSSPYNTFDRLVYRKLKRRQPVGIVREYHTERDFHWLMAQVGLKVVDTVYFDFSVVIPPLEKGFPGLASSSRRRLEGLARSSFRRLGNGFVMSATKPN